MNDQKITELTKEQTDRFDEFVNKWTNIALSCDKTDKVEAEKSIKKCYELAKLEEPDFIVWSASPISQTFSRAFFMALIDCDLVKDFYKFIKKNEKIN